MLFDSTVRRDLARGFGATLVVILTIVITMFLIRTVGQAASGAVSPQDVVLLLGYVALGHLPTMLALSLFVAIVVTLGRMYRDSEMAIWFASGVGLGRFVRPVLSMGWPVLLVVALLLLFVWPWGNRSSLELRDRYQQRPDLSRVTPGVFQTSRDGKRVFFVEREHAAATDARSVFILTLGERLESVITAMAGRISAQAEQSFLVLERGQRNDVNLVSGERALSRFEGYRVLVSERAVHANESPSPKIVATSELIARPIPAYLGELTWRLGLALGTVNLMLLGVGLAATNPRRASNWNLLFALLAFVIYFNLINLSQAWVANERMPMAAALGGLHGGVLMLALALLWWRDHAAVTRLPGTRALAR
jgi:lipopolysaccharide export system permease protein